MGNINHNLPFKVGDKVTSKFHRGEEHVIRTITFCSKNTSFGSGYVVSSDGGEQCKCCGKPEGMEIQGVDSTWFTKV